MRILVTGHAGFIGFHTASRLLARGDTVVGVDTLDAYYDPTLKEMRLDLLERQAAASGSGYYSHRNNLTDRPFVADLFRQGRFDRVIHLAAQAGVRYSIVDPHAYAINNIVAFTNLLEGCRHAAVEHLTYASTSSVYGANTRMPFRESDSADHPLQFYAATKRANELMAHSYSHLFGLPTSGLRFFTVYGPWVRPDMALYRFAECIYEGRPIDVFNYGDHVRDFTYVDDIVEGILRVNDQAAAPDPHWDAGCPNPATSNAPFRLLNIGNSEPVPLNRYIDAIEAALGKTAQRNLLPLQPGDVPATYADIGALEEAVGSWPRIRVEEGVGKFVEWYLEYREIRRRQP